ncbi:MAG: transposase [Aeoliella sp.]
MRYWLLTSTTYGSWLPGDVRGSITSVRDYRPTDASTNSRIEHDVFGTPWEPPIPGLRRSAEALLKSPPVVLTLPQAEAALAQFQETARFRSWRLLAAAIMTNHFHLVIGATNDSQPRKMLNDLKAYGSRALNRRFGKTKSSRWWTSGGSKRWLRGERAVHNAIRYVIYKQPNPLVTWFAKDATDIA